MKKLLDFFFRKKKQKARKKRLHDQFIAMNEFVKEL